MLSIFMYLLALEKCVCVLEVRGQLCGVSLSIFMEVSRVRIMLPGVCGKGSCLMNHYLITLFVLWNCVYSLFAYFLKRFYLFYVYDCFVCMFICTSEETIRSHGTTVIDSCEPPCGCWELNSWPLEEQPVLLTSEPFLQLPHLPGFW